MKRGIKKGYLVLEVLLAAVLFVIFATGGIIGLISALNFNRSAKERVEAVNYAQEGVEAARSIRNRSFSELANTAGTGLRRNGSTGVWEYNGAANNELDSRYTRTLVVEEVDANTKKATANVNWSFTPFLPLSVSLSTYLTNWKAAIAAAGPPIMVYSKTTNLPYYRTWNGSVWSGEGSAGTVGGNINFVELEASRTRDEAVLGTLDANGNIYAQVWNGSSWGTPTLMANIGSANATTRSFDVAYEKSSDRAVFAYLPNSTSVDFAYRIWDGSSWSSPLTVSTPPTTAVIKWIEMTQNPVGTSNEIALILLDDNIDVYGMVWTGSVWSNMGAVAVWDASASIATKKAIDVAYEQTSGRAMFMWGDATSTDQYYRIWNGTSLTSATLLDIAAAGGVAHWVKLVSRPGSNELMYGELDAAADLNTRKWSGSAWDTATQHAEHSAAAENITSMVFDLIWETHPANPGKAWLLWGNGARVSKKQWSGTAWESASVLTGSDDTSFIRLKAVSDTGEVMAGMYESATSATDDIWESHLAGGGTAWSAENTLWGGPISAEPVYFRIDIAGQ